MPQSEPVTLWSVHSGLPRDFCGALFTSFPPCSDPHSTPAHPLRKLDLAVSRKTSKASFPVLTPDVHSWAHPPTHTHTLPAVPAGTSGPRGRGQAGDFQSLVSWVSSQALAGNGGSDSLWSHCPHVTLEWSTCEKAPRGAASQSAASRGPSTPILPPPEGDSEIQLGKQRKWEQREGKSFPVKRKEGGCDPASQPPSRL